MPAFQFLLGFEDHPKAKKFVTGQRITLNLTGTIQMTREGAMVKVDTINVGKRSKMSTQETLLRQLNDRVANIDKTMPKQSVAM